MLGWRCIRSANIIYCYCYYLVETAQSHPILDKTSELQRHLINSNIIFDLALTFIKSSFQGRIGSKFTNEVMCSEPRDGWVAILIDSFGCYESNSYWFLGSRLIFMIWGPMGKFGEDSGKQKQPSSDKPSSLMQEGSIWEVQWHWQDFNAKGKVGICWTASGGRKEQLNVFKNDLASYGAELIHPAVVWVKTENIIYHCVKAMRISPNILGKKLMGQYIRVENK